MLSLFQPAREHEASMNSPAFASWTLAVRLMLPALASPLGAQAVTALKGRVLSDANDSPLRGADVSIASLGLSSLTDSLGAFTLRRIPAGRQIVWVRKVGYAPVSIVLSFTPGDTLDRDFALTASVTRLPAVEVKAAPHLSPTISQFEERRAAGFGHFITEAQLEKMENRRLSEIFAMIPGPVVIKGQGNHAWIAGGRGPQSYFQNGDELDPFDYRRGAKRRFCYSAIVLDGIFVYTGHPGETLFDINTLQPNTIAGIEVYTGPATIPPQYGGARSTCGLIVVWTKG
jgi:hypothetical protein